MSLGEGGQCDKEVTAFPLHRTAHLMPNLSIPAGIQSPPACRVLLSISCLANANPKAARVQGEWAGCSVQLGAGTWVYKYACVKAGACGNHSCLVRDSLRNAVDPGPTFRGAV